MGIKVLQRLGLFMIDLKTRFHGLGGIIFTLDQFAAAAVAHALLLGGNSHHMVAVPPKQEGVCDKCGGKLVQRKDDAPETVKARLEVYHKETEPLKDFYAQRGLLKPVENQPSVEETSRAILHALGR